MERLEQILLKYHVTIKKTNAGAAIDAIEKMLKFRLPPDYLFYLLNYASFEGYVGSEYIQLWSVDELMELNRAYDIVNHLPLTLGIGSNGSSEFIALERTNKEGFRIVLSPFIDLDSQYHVVIGSSFTDFLECLDSGHPWFNDEV